METRITFPAKYIPSTYQELSDLQVMRAFSVMRFDASKDLPESVCQRGGFLMRVTHTQVAIPGLNIAHLKVTHGSALVFDVTRMFIESRTAVLAFVFDELDLWLQKLSMRIMAHPCSDDGKDVV